MTDTARELDLIKIFSSLSEIPLACKEKTKALRRITELGREALRSHACTLVFVDLDNKYLTQEACAGFDKGFEERMAGRKIHIGPLQHGCFLDSNLIAKGEVVETYALQRNGQGVANPKTAEKYNLNGVLSYPLKSNDRLIGYLNHFSSESFKFTEADKKLLEIFARQAVVTIERLEYHRTLDRSISILNVLSKSLLLKSPADFLKQVSDKARELLSAPICIVWKLDERQKKLRIVATTGDVDDEYTKIELNPDDPGIKLHLSSKRAAYLSDVTKSHPKYGHSAEARARGWVSLLSAPMLHEDRIIGMLDVYMKNTRYFKEWEKEFFLAFSNHAALSIQKAELLSEAVGRRRLEKLNEIVKEMTEASDVENLLELILNRGLELVQATRGWIGLLDLKTGELHTKTHRGDPPKLRPLKIGEGITGETLQNEKPTRVDDVRSREWERIYVEFWEDTRSELAVPILITKAQVRVGRELSLGSKPIGVFNVESPIIAAFSKADEDCLSMLAHHVALMIERLELDQKHANLDEIEKEIIGKQDRDEIIRNIMAGVTNTLGYEYLNISLVKRGLNTIQTEYIIGILESEVEEFKRRANHSLDSDDIQADIVKSRAIEVPGTEDKRFDPEIFKRFGHDRLIRVFIPMISPSDNSVIGTVEAGYQRGYRKYIYERDIQILKGFVDYAAIALDRKKKDSLLERIGHEFSSAIVGIRGIASLLQRRIKELSEDLIQLKLDDILTDCEILLSQVIQLQYILGGSSPISRRERTLVFRDIIIKTIKQLRPLVAEQGFEASRIQYRDIDIGKLIIYVEKAKLNQVVYNLLTNSLKYAENDPNAFAIQIEVDETKTKFIVKFKDWGIGIRNGLEEKIFEEGFRTPEAINKHVAGSGLGLTIARKIMEELDGDLKLAHNYKPTEFHMLLPKNLSEALR